MRRWLPALVLLLGRWPVARCRRPPIPSRLPPGIFGPMDQDVGAAQYAQYAFADSARTYGRPELGAQAVLAIDYLGGGDEYLPALGQYRRQYADAVAAGPGAGAAGGGDRAQRAVPIGGDSLAGRAGGSAVGQPACGGKGAG